jgi:hypothetical protein
MKRLILLGFLTRGLWFAQAPNGILSCHVPRSLKIIITNTKSQNTTFITSNIIKKEPEDRRVNENAF